jgi:PadR family transcriptional regulator PadR
MSLFRARAVVATANQWTKLRRRSGTSTGVGRRAARCGRITDTEILILSALEADELYGREVIDVVEALTSGKRTISLAGLYTTLNRMETKGLIAGRWGDKDEVRDGARRRYYKVTGAGARMLSEMRAALRVKGRNK